MSFLWKINSCYERNGLHLVSELLRHVETGNISNGLHWKNKLWHAAYLSYFQSPFGLLLLLKWKHIYLCLQSFSFVHRLCRAGVNSIIVCLLVPVETSVWPAALTAPSAWPRRPSARMTSLRSQKVSMAWRRGWFSSGIKPWWGHVNIERGTSAFVCGSLVFYVVSFTPPTFVVCYTTFIFLFLVSLHPCIEHAAVLSLAVECSAGSEM